MTVVMKNRVSLALPILCNATRTSATTTVDEKLPTLHVYGLPIRVGLRDAGIADPPCVLRIADELVVVRKGRKLCRLRDDLAVAHLVLLGLQYVDLGRATAL